MGKPLTKLSLAIMAIVTLLAFTSGWWFTHVQSTDLSLSVSKSTVTQNHQRFEQGDLRANVLSQNMDRAAASNTPYGQTKTSAPADLESLELFNQLLHDYHSGELAQDDKILMEQTLRELNTTVTGRLFIVDIFFSADKPQLAKSMYELILDADLKDLSLIRALIGRDRMEFALASKTRIVDLVADLMAQEDAPYSVEIDDYLARMALHSDSTVRNAAKSQRVWYITHHQPSNVAILSEYLLDNSPDIRQEMYDLIEAQASGNSLTNLSDLALALTSLLHADYLGISRQEEERIIALNRKLGGTPNSPLGE
jgi:hypothetical protein